MTDDVAPALSTTQDADIEFAKTDDSFKNQPRRYIKSGTTNLDETLTEYYSLDDLAKYLETKSHEGSLHFNRVALQFPDRYVRDSTIVCRILQGMTKLDVWVLADTSYSPCCIDEVAARHVSADIVVHFGDACLNPVEKTLSAYIFGKPYFDIPKAVNLFKEAYTKADKVCIMADAPYSRYINSMYKTLKPEYPNLIYADVDFNKAGNRSTVIDEYPQADLPGVEAYDISRIIRAISLDPSQREYSDITQDYALFYIGFPPDPKKLLLSTKFGGLTVLDPYDMSTSSGNTPSISRRYRFMMMTKHASTIGVLVNTLSLENTRKILNKVVKWIKDAGKKHYMFVVGKPNVAKLANFDTIDVWCILGCSQSGIIIDSYGDYYKPIITPYELQLALMPEVTWTGKWVVDFNEVMNQDGYRDDDEDQKKKEDKDTDKDEYAPEFDPVTGKLVASNPLKQIKHLELELEDEPKLIKSSSDDKTLAKKFSSELMIGSTVSTSALSLQNKSWTGLGSDYKDQEMDESGAELEEGRSGIAREYGGDLENTK